MPEDINVPLEALNRLMLRFELPAINQVIGRGVQQAVRTRLFALDGERPNALGGKRSHFWGQCANSTGYRVEGQNIEVYIAHVGIRLRLLGGVVRPGKGISSHTGKPTQLLAYPAIAEAYGKRPVEFDNLKIGMAVNQHGNMQKALVVDDHSDFTPFWSKHFKKTGVEVEQRSKKAVFWLAKSTTHKADPGAIPDQLILDACKSACEEMFAR